jgi:hypothetical protein
MLCGLNVQSRGKQLWIQLTRTERKRVVQVVVKTVFVRGEHVERIEFNRPFAALFKA